MRLFHILLLFGILFRCMGQSDPELTFSVRQFGMEEGLIHRRVLQAVQDEEGFIWLATPAGVQRFDGYSFTNYTTEDGLTTNAVSMIWPDPDGLLWVVSMTDFSEGHIFAIDILDPRTGKILPYAKHFGNAPPVPLEELVDKAIALNDGSLLLAGQARLVIYHSAAKGSTVIKTSTDHLLRPLVMTQGGVVWCVRTEPMEDFSQLVKVQPTGRVTPVDDRDFRLGDFGVVDGCDLRSGERSFYFLAEQQHVATHEFRITPEGEFERMGEALRPGDLFKGTGTVYRDLGEGRVLVGPKIHELSGRSAPRNGKVLLDLAKVDPKLSVDLNSTLVDRAGNIWLCSNFGLWQLTIRRNAFHRWLQRTDTATGLGRTTRAMQVIGDTLYVNTDEDGWWGVDTRSGNIRRKDDGHWAMRCAMAPDGHGGLFANCSFRLMHWRNGRLVVPMFTTERMVHSIFPMGDERLLLGTNVGLAWADTSLTRYVPFTDAEQGKAANAMVFAFHRDRAGTIWAGTTRGLCELDVDGTVRAIWSQEDSTHYLPGDDFQHIYEDPHGIFWLSTGTSGLIRWDRSTGDVRSITMRDGLPSNGIYAVYPDQRGRFWMPTDYGIVRYDTLTGQVFTYTVADGITDNEFNCTSHTQGPDGRLYFGGMNGVTAFHPDDLVDQHYGSPLVIAHAEQLDGGTGKLMDRTAEITRTRTITMRPSDRFFTLRMALLSYEKPSNVLYGWRIDGVDNDWNNQRDPELRLVSLPYGSHRLHIRAKGGSGEWNEQELALTINVIRPWYLRWWAVVLFATAIIGGVYLLFRIRLARLRAVMAMRDRIALDLHDEVGSTLSSVALFSTALRNTNRTHSEKESNMLDRIAENSAQAMESMNDIVWSVNTRYEKLSDVKDRMLAYAGPLAETCAWELEIHVEEGLQDLRLSMNERKNLYLVFKEAVNNAAKHARCDRVRVQVRKQGQGLELTIVDNGAGVSGEAQGRNGLGGNGLRSMKERAEAIGGSLLVEQAEQGGTVITLRFTPHRE